MKTICITLISMFFFQACAYKGSEIIVSQDSLDSTSSLTLRPNQLYNFQEGQLSTIPQGTIQKTYGTIECDGHVINGHKYFLLIDSLKNSQSSLMPQHTPNPNLEFNMPNKILQNITVVPSS